jgi:hypothetical protein
MQIAEIQHLNCKIAVIEEKLRWEVNVWKKGCGFLNCPCKLGFIDIIKDLFTIGLPCYQIAEFMSALGIQPDVLRNRS